MVVWLGRGSGCGAEELEAGFRECDGMGVYRGEEPAEGGEEGIYK